MLYEERKQKEQESSKIRKLWPVFLVAGVFAAGIILAVVLQSRNSQVSYEPVKQAKVAYFDQIQIPDPPEPEVIPWMQELYDQNSDIVGWIKIDGTNIDYPVMFTPEDGEYYLYRAFNKEMDPEWKGCPFVDVHCSVDPRSTNLLIHGHNMDNGTMFHELEKYMSEDFYKEHPTFQYTTMYEEQEFEIVAVFKSKVFLKSQTDVFKFYQFYNAENQEQFDSYIKNCKALQLYDTGVTATYGDELITLSTCEYSQENGRLVVVARKKGKV